MDSRIKQLWVDALRGPEFKQGSHALRRKDSNGDSAYCCLGVLCELAAREEVIPPAHYSESLYQYTYAGSPHYLPPRVAEWAGLDSYNPEVHSHFGVRPLANVNDSGESFSVIADYIEGEL